MPSLRANNMDEETMRKLLEAQTDIAGAHTVEIVVSKKNSMVHVNVNEVCVLRISAAAFLRVERRR